MLTKLRRTFNLLTLIGILAVCVTFSVVNREYISVSLFPLPYEAELPKFLFGIICFSLGIFTSALAMTARSIKIKRLMKSEHRRAMALDNEIKTLQAEHANSPSIAVKSS